MNGSLKKSSKILYGVCSCIIVLMVICYFGVSNTKGTYSATSACPNGYNYVGGTYCCPSGSTFVSESYGCTKTYTYNTQGEASKARLSLINNGTARSCDEVKNVGNFKFTCALRAQTYNCKSNQIVSNGTCVNNCFANFVGTSGTQSLECQNATLGGYYVNAPSSGYGSKSNATFYAWNTSKSCSGTVYGAGTKVSFNSSGATYYACFKCNNTTSEYVGYDEECSSDQLSSSVTLTFMNGSTKVKSQSCTIPSGASRCSSDIIAPGAQTKTGDTTGEYKFNGWGEKDGCETGSYTANAAFAPSVSKTYYACYRKSSNDVTSSDFDSSKCTYSSLYTVTRDERYLNCKYTNITYNNSATENIAGNVSACCRNKGYTWVAENFTSSGYGNEYCIVCGSTPGGGPNPPSSSSSSKPSSSSSSSKPSSSSSLTGPGSPTPSSNVDDNPKTGSVAIFMVWVIALGTLIYSFVYFKQSKFE